MVSKRMLWLIPAVVMFLAAPEQGAPRRGPKVAPIPNDPLELVIGPIQVANTPASRDAAFQLLGQARNNYQLRNSGRGYDLKVTFTVNSGGQTDYDGLWEMEDVSDPKLGLRWTARAAAGYTTSRISSTQTAYEDGTASVVPLRLHEARAALLDPMPALKSFERDLIRTSSATYNGLQVTCFLLSGSGNPATATPGRRWEETEECIDPQTGLLRVHSQVPGRYFAYEYANAPQLGDYKLPRKVIVTEASKIVSEISVESLKEVPAADPSLFVPTEEMKTRGPAIVMAEAQKIARYSGRGPFTSSTTVEPVCVFGLVTPAGQLVEAHSLQPSNPNSQAAVEAANQMIFRSPDGPGGRPQQHFVFILETFASSH